VTAIPDAPRSATKGDAYKPPYMPWFEGDFMGSFRVRQLKPRARLMYRSLLQQAWRSHNPPYLPADDAALALMADAKLSEWKRHKDSILKMFTRTDDGQWLFHPKSVDLYQRVQAEHVAKQRGGHMRRTGESAGKSEFFQQNNGSSAAAEHKDSNSTPAANLLGTLKDTSTNQNQNQNQGGEAPPGLHSMQYARGLLENLSIVPTPADLPVAADAIRLLAKRDGIDEAAATDRMLQLARAAQARGDKVSRWWFQDGRWADASQPKNQESTPTVITDTKAFVQRQLKAEEEMRRERGIE
jgi:uncharacterized protein YdaU (DUF1376 family)